MAWRYICRHVYPNGKTHGMKRFDENTATLQPQTLHPLMLAGTGSDVGKSVIATALCRIFRQDGYSPAPFKAQNMALNSAVTPSGDEIGRAQAVQAEACGVPPSADMNPVLLKPQTDKTSQVVLNGRVYGTRDAYSYFKTEGRDVFRRAACDAFDRLRRLYNPIVMEGAGSVSELNLRDTDFVNLPMARHAGADVLLVADIDRGGIFASAYGSVMLQRPEERGLIKGIIVNKFRGDIRLFEKGARMLEEICQVPVLGVIPYFTDIHIEEEDSLPLALKRHTFGGVDTVSVAVVMLRHMSNFTDFDALEQDPRATLFYTADPQDAAHADVIILPGTKNTIADLAELRRSGMAKAVIQARRDGKTVLGVCGGYQMMGTMIADPERVEGVQELMPGLGLLPVSTVMRGVKTTRQTTFSFAGDSSCGMTGYEIHNGETTLAAEGTATSLFRRTDGSAEGCLSDDRCMGTYMHGVLDNAAFRDFLLAPWLGQTAESHTAADWQTFKEEQYDRLADHVRRHLDMQKLYSILTA